MTTTQQPGQPQATVSWRQWLTERRLDELIHVADDRFLDRPWMPGEGDRDAAFELYTELRSRITTHTLNYQDGDEASALDSVYRIFDLSRGIIHRHGRSCRHFAHLSLLVLNRIIRPFTARWHRKKLRGELASQFNRHAFRAELQQLQSALQRFVEALGWLAEGEDYRPPETFPAIPAPASEPVPTTSSTRATPAPLAGPSPHWHAGLLDPAEIPALESRDIQARRERLGSGAFGIDERMGLALSGGGIRSATFSLGVVQSLARHGVLRDVDYLSTVSGGGYLGSFLSSYLGNTTHPAHSPLSPPAPGAGEAPALRHLRNHSKYLLGKQRYSPWQDLGAVLLGIVQHLLCLVPVLLLGLLGLAWLARCAWVQSISDVVLLVVLPLLVLYLLFSPEARQLLDSDRALPPPWRSAPLAGLLLSAVAALLTALDLLFSEFVPALGAWVRPWLLALPILPVAGAVLALRSQRSLWQRLAGMILGATVPLALLGWYLALGSLLFQSGDAHAWLWLLLLALSVAGLILGAGLNINDTGLHHLYRRHLARCYLIAPDPDGRPRRNRDPRLSGLSPPDGIAPYHLLNVAVNFPGSDNLELRGRNADFFVLSKYACGSVLSGYVPTRALEKRVPDLDLGAAMAISGAALASRMGTLTVPGTVWLLTLLNLRLGYWLPNPRCEHQPHPDIANARDLWRELLGTMTETDPLVNLSDGGHIENLGVYELLRRRCRFIVAVDAGADPGLRCGELLTLMRYASIDLATRIEIRLDDLQTNEHGHSREQAVLGVIHYDDGSRGHLLYLKPTLLGNESPTIVDYRHRHPVFPHESTADQLFGEAQFEAYRALGEAVMDNLFRQELLHPLIRRGELTKDRRNFNARVWLTALEESLLPVAR